MTPPRYNPDPDLPKTAIYRRGRRKHPPSKINLYQARKLLCRADEMRDELLIRIAVLEGTITEFGLMEPGREAPRPCDPTPASLWLKEDAADPICDPEDQPARDPGGTP